jgi:hypothetical protein
MGQEPDLARMTQEYIRLYTPMVFMSFFVVGMRKFLQGLGTVQQKQSNS